MATPRLHFAAAILVACLFAAGAGLLLAERRADLGAATASASEFAGAVRPDIPMTPLSGLHDQDGRGLDMASLRGRPVIVTFVYSTCEDTCPILVQSIRGALDRLGEDLPVVAVSVDPARDTPRSAQRFVAKQRMIGRMRFMVGSRAALRPVWRQYGIGPQTADLEHSAHVVLLDERGHQRVGWPAAKLTPAGLEHDLRRLLDASTA